MPYQALTWASDLSNAQHQRQSPAAEANFLARHPARLRVDGFPIPGPARRRSEAPGTECAAVVRRANLRPRRPTFGTGRWSDLRRPESPNVNGHRFFPKGQDWPTGPMATPWVECRGIPGSPSLASLLSVACINRNLAATAPRCPSRIGRCPPTPDNPALCRPVSRSLPIPMTDYQKRAGAAALRGRSPLHEPQGRS